MLPDQENDIFEAATSGPETTTIEPPATAAAEPGASDAQARAAVEGQAPADGQSDAQRQPGGDLTVALRQEREARKAERAELERIRAEQRTLQQVLDRLTATQPQPQQPAEKDPNYWEDPGKFTSSTVEKALTPIEQRMVTQTLHFSHREAVREFGAETVTAAETALRQAVEAGQLRQEDVAASLRSSIDPVGDMVRWHKSTPEVQEQTLRSKFEAEFKAKYGIPADGGAPPAASAQPEASAPGITVLPSLNQAHGNAGGPQSGTESEEDIFNATPAFGTKRKA